MTNLRYHCPFGPTFLRATTAKEMAAKFAHHNMTAHGPYPIYVCGARGVRAKKSPAPPVARGYSLSGRGV